MDCEKFINFIKNSRNYKDQIVYIKEIPYKRAQYRKLKDGIDEKVANILNKMGISRLYSHQVKAIEIVRRGENPVIVTSTSSGKTYCYLVPALEYLLKNPKGRMLFIYPTKALAQDQLKTINKIKSFDKDLKFKAGTYDGDTPVSTRKSLRDKGNVILTNPDMLHQGILPNHSLWSDFFENLKFIVIDEIHTYRGIFGSNFGNVMKRLKRICKLYNCEPQFIASSATIANPVELTEGIISEKAVLVDNDGSPNGAKKFILWNPPLLDTEGLERRSSLTDGEQIMTELIKNKIQTITFTNTRIAAEIIAKYVSESLLKKNKSLSAMVRSYRGGYLPEERREIERSLASGELMGVSSTNALELGIDIGSLDAAILVGYPGTIASTRQRAGRAGRGEEESVIFLIAQNSPIDQFLMRDPEYLFKKNTENAVINPENPFIVHGHLKCAAQEKPVTKEDIETFGKYSGGIIKLLEDEGEVKNTPFGYKWNKKDYPAKDVNLRSNNTTIYTILDVENNQVIGTIDEESAFSQVHKHAVYLHRGEIYFVENLDTERKIAAVVKKDLDYYTQSESETIIKIDRQEIKKNWNECSLWYGDLTVTSSVIMFKKIKFYTRESLGFEGLSLPAINLETVGFWFKPPKSVVYKMSKYGRSMMEGLAGLGNLILETSPLIIMCDPSDIGSVADTTNLGVPALFIYDKISGGLGFSKKIYDNFIKIIENAFVIIDRCPCKSGCPSCVGSARTPYSGIDSGIETRGKIPDKEATLIILYHILGKGEYIPKFFENIPKKNKLAKKKFQPPKLSPLPPDIENKIRRKIRGE